MKPRAPEIGHYAKIKIWSGGWQNWSVNKMEDKDSGFYNDDGTEINPDLVPKPGLCLCCKKDDDPNEEILCILNRADQQGEAEFKCFAYVLRNSWNPEI